MEVDDNSPSLPCTPPSTPLITGISSSLSLRNPSDFHQLILSPNLPRLIKQYQRYFRQETEVFLHDDIVHIISSFASGGALAKMAMVSKSWKDISGKSCYWTKALYTDFGIRTEELRSKQTDYSPHPHPKHLYQSLHLLRSDAYREHKIDPVTVRSIRQNGISSNTYRYLLFNSNAHYFMNRSSSNTGYTYA